jgi:hypothetical protein
MFLNIPILFPNRHVHDAVLDELGGNRGETARKNGRVQ